MKNIFTGLMIFCIAFTSCTKDSKKQTTPGNKLYNVTFGVADFSEQHTGFVTNSLKITNGLIKTDATMPVPYVPADTATQYRTILYMVYDSTGTYVHQIQQYQGNAGFGTINDQLPPGKYSIFFIGAENDGPGAGVSSKYLTYKKNQTIVPLSEQQISYKNTTTFEWYNDTFYKSLTLNVTSGNITQGISLDRIVSQLDVVIQDAIPAGITNITITTTPTSIAFALATGIPITSTIYHYGAVFPISAGITGTTNYGMSNIIPDSPSPVTVTITANSSSGIIAQKIISNVTITANTQTILEGNLFGGASTGTGGSITAKGDTSWNPVPLNYHF